MPGVVVGLYAAVAAFTAPGQGVLTQVPIYPPFLAAIRDQRRTVLANPLRETPEGYRLDLAGLERLAFATRLLLFCHPHNPTGRVFGEEELAALAQIARRHDLIVVSDELHAPSPTRSPTSPWPASSRKGPSPWWARGRPTTWRACPSGRSSAPSPWWRP